MQLNKEVLYHGTGRKASVQLLRKHWDNSFSVWEVALYQNENVIERKTVISQQLAESIAKDFVDGGYGNTGNSMLLNEGK